MATWRLFTRCQREVMQAIADGVVVRKVGRGYRGTLPDGTVSPKSFRAVKSLAYPLDNPYVASTGETGIYFTSRGWRAFMGDAPQSAELAEKVARVDVRVMLVREQLEGG